MDRSRSLPKIESQGSIARQNSGRLLDSRLNFPIPGDSSLFSNVGRKHYQNHSDRMLRIILPQKYAMERPIRPIRESSLPPPHLVRHTSERIFQNKEQIREDVQRIRGETSLREKIEDQLDRMRRSMDRSKKTISLPAVKAPEKTVEVQEKSAPMSSKHQGEESHKISTLFSLTPAVSIKVESKVKQSGPRLLYNPENKEKYDSLLMGRWKNPTNLSTGLSII